MTAARVLLFIHAAFLLLIALVLGAVANKSGHPAVFGIVAAVNGIFGVSLIVAGVKMGGCENWTRVFAIVFECLVILNNLAVVLSGGPIGVLGLALAIAVIVLLSTAPSRACFAGR